MFASSKNSRSSGRTAMSSTHEAFSLPTSSPRHTTDGFAPGSPFSPEHPPPTASSTYSYPPQSPSGSYDYVPTTYVLSTESCSILKLTFGQRLVTSSSPYTLKNPKTIYIYIQRQPTSQVLSVTSAPQQHEHDEQQQQQQYKHCRIDARAVPSSLTNMEPTSFVAFARIPRTR